MEKQAGCKVDTKQGRLKYCPVISVNESQVVCQFLNECEFPSMLMTSYVEHLSVEHEIPVNYGHVQYVGLCIQDLKILQDCKFIRLALTYNHLCISFLIIFFSVTMFHQYTFWPFWAVFWTHFLSRRGKSVYHSHQNSNRRENYRQFTIPIATFRPRCKVFAIQ